MTRSLTLPYAPSLLSPRALKRALALSASLTLSPFIAPSLSEPSLSVSVSYAKELDRIVAVVNEEVVTLSELMELTMPFQRQLQSVADPLKRSELMREQERQALEQLISQRLLIQVAREQGVKVSDEQVEGHLQSVMRQQGWGEAELSQYLGSQGMTRDQLKEQSREFLLQQNVTQRNLATKMQLSERDLKSAYQDFLTEAKAEARVEGAHIMLPVPAGSDAATEAATKQLAQELLVRAQAGESFESLAAQHSQGPGAAQGGDLGVITRGGGLPQELEAAFFKLKEGEFSGPIRSPFGYHVIKVTRLASAEPPSFEQVKPQLEGRLRQARFQEALQEWIDKLKGEAFIERKL